LQSRHLCHCRNIVVALAAMASMRSSSWCPHPCRNGIITIVNAQVSLLLYLWHCYPGCAGAIAKIARALYRPCCPCVVVLIALTSLPSCCIGVITIITPVLLPLSTWHVCAVVLVSLPLSHWHCRPRCAGIIALIAQASLPLLCLHCAVDLQASSPLLSWHVLTHRRHGRLRRRQRQHQRNKVNNASATRAAMPAQ
jgi:hypothetical protein